MALPQLIREAAEAAKSGQATRSQLATLRDFLGTCKTNDVFLADGIERARTACERHSARDAKWMVRWLDGILARIL